MSRSILRVHSAHAFTTPVFRGQGQHDPILLSSFSIPQHCPLPGSGLFPFLLVSAPLCCWLLCVGSCAVYKCSGTSTCTKFFLADGSPIECFQRPTRAYLWAVSVIEPPRSINTQPPAKSARALGLLGCLGTVVKMVPARNKVKPCFRYKTSTCLVCVPPAVNTCPPKLQFGPMVGKTWGRSGN